jgi:hypothetical protein
MRMKENTLHTVTFIFTVAGNAAARRRVHHCSTEMSEALQHGNISVPELVYMHAHESRARRPSL